MRMGLGHASGHKVHVSGFSGQMSCLKRADERADELMEPIHSHSVSLEFNVRGGTEGIRHFISHELGCPCTLNIISGRE